MNYRTIWTAGGLAALGLMLVALPSLSRTTQEQQDEKSLARVQAQLEADVADQQEAIAEQAEARAELAAGLEGEFQEMAPPADLEREVHILASMDEGAGWLGVEIHEVTSQAAKDFKLPAERGVVLSKVAPDSPAAKAGLKDNDVVTEINGQRVEGAAQFRRIIHEIPAGRTAQLTVWRGGRSQTISATLGKAEEAHKAWMKALPAMPSGDFAFTMPVMPNMPNMPNMPGMRTFEWKTEMLAGNRPRLGIDAEDLSGDFGKYFGAPEGEGILVRSVNPASPAEKAGLKAGDVILKYNGERIRTVGDLREKLAGLREAKEAKTVKLDVLRNRSEMTLDVTIEPPAAAPKAAKAAQRTHI